LLILSCLCATVPPLSTSPTTGRPQIHVHCVVEERRTRPEPENPRGITRGVARAELDGVVLAGTRAPIPLKDDGATHRVHVILG
jgi:hypothetical protein